MEVVGIQDNSHHNAEPAVQVVDTRDARVARILAVAQILAEGILHAAAVDSLPVGLHVDSHWMAAGPKLVVALDMGRKVAPGMGHTVQVGLREGVGVLATSAAPVAEANVGGSLLAVVRLRKGSGCHETKKAYCCLPDLESLPYHSDPCYVHDHHAFDPLVFALPGASHLHHPQTLNMALLEDRGAHPSTHLDGERNGKNHRACTCQCPQIGTSLS